MLDHYSRGLVTEIDATRPPVEVLSKIISKVVTLPVYQDTADQVV